MSMSAKSAKSSKIDRPFASEILRQAKEIAARYQVVLQFEDGLFLGRGLELPLVMNDGKTADECVRKTRDALAATVAYMLEQGQRPPTPASEENRSVQVNVRLTPSEKAALEQAARNKGFRGLSDYVRHAALSSNQ